MNAYLNLLKHILDNGTNKHDRTKTGTKSIFGYQLRFNLQDGFPLLTTKKLHFKSIVYELLWLLKGDTNVGFLNKHNVSIWNEWADDEGNLGPIYGKQWRSWQDYNNHPIDQISNAINLIKNDPTSRRIIVSSWNVADLKKMALAPCHVMFQFYVTNQDLYCHLYQRSSDVFLGLPFNIASYALLTTMIGYSTKTRPKDLIISLGDAHLYNNHLDQAKLQLTRTPGELPTLQIHSSSQNIFELKYEDFKLINYQAAPHIKADVAI